MQSRRDHSRLCTRRVWAINNFAASRVLVGNHDILDVGIEIDRNYINIIKLNEQGVNLRYT